MTDLTQWEEQEMIERAKNGDPEANYKMSFWALEQAAAEPAEERWNRLAAKCLVKAAKAGYEPARQRMNQLLTELEAREKSEPIPPAPAPAARQEEPAETAPPEEKGAARGRGLLGKTAELLPRKNAETEGGWSDEKWKKMQRLCIIACVVLAFLIVLMWTTGRSGRGEGEVEPQMPTAAAAESIASTPTPSPEPYPDELVRETILGAALAIYPEDGDYVKQATTARVSVTTGLNLRTGPASSYDQIVMMADGTELSIYAEKNGWVLVLYEGETYGWCSKDYLHMN